MPSRFSFARPAAVEAIAISLCCGPETLGTLLSSHSLIQQKFTIRLDPRKIILKLTYSLKL